MLDSHLQGKLDPIQSKIDGLDSSMSEVKGEVKALMSGASLRQISQLPPKALSRALPHLHKLLSSPIPHSELTKDTADRLAASLNEVDESSPEYWLAVIKFIQVVSNGLATDVPPPGRPNFIFRGVGISGPIFGKFSHKIVELDGGEMVGQRFEHCRVIFTNHPVILQNVLFVDCVFQMPSDQHPNNYIKSVAKQLLATNLSKIHHAS